MARSTPQGVLNYLNSWVVWVQLFVQAIVVVVGLVYFVPALVQLLSHKGTWFAVFTPAIATGLVSIIIWDFPSLIAMTHGN